MGFKEAVRVCMTEKYVTFSGRAPRSEFWWFNLFVYGVALILALLGVLTMAMSNGEPSMISIILFSLAGIFFLAVVLPLISVTVRRFHDVKLSGWLYLLSIVLGMIPYVGFLASIAVIVVTVLKGTDGANKFGPDPLKPESGAEVFA